MVIKYRIISGCVIVIGPPFAICLVNKGTTEPLDPKTFPKRVVINLVLFISPEILFLNCKDCTYFSAILLLAPITLLGFTALSVDTITNFLTLCWQDKSAKILVPSILVKIA